MEKGYIHVYTGDGKGKTTAALGLSLRALMAGKRVYMGQFVKNMKYSEVDAQDLFPHFQIVQLGLGCQFEKTLDETDVLAAREGLKKLKEAYRTFDVVIADEIFIALYLKLLSLSEVLSLMAEKPPQVELILTGRYAPEAVIKEADLVTEMKEIKHYFQQGVLSRKGIDC